jgi:hypothetical protein
VSGAALVLSERYHPKAPCARPLNGRGTSEALPERFFNQAAKRDSGRRRGSLGPPEYVIVKLHRGAQKKTIKMNDGKSSDSESVARVLHFRMEEY